MSGTGATTFLLNFSSSFFSAAFFCLLSHYYLVLKSPLLKKLIITIITETQPDPKKQYAAFLRQNHYTFQYLLGQLYIRMKLSQFIGGDSLKEQLKSTRQQQFVKALGRDIKPAWSNRFDKDFYDLEYDIPSSLDKMGNKFVKNEPAKMNRYAIGSKDKMEAAHNKSEVLARRKSPKQKPYLLDIKRPNPERIHITQDAQKAVLGLCPYEYGNTIEGRMQKKSSHHLSYQKNKVKRSTNEYPIYYNKDESLDLSNSQISEQKRKLRMYHPFGSYTKRRTFEPRDQLDKIFDTDSGHRATSPKRIPELVPKFETMLQRMEPKLSESVVLQYDVLPAVCQLKKKSISYPLAKEQRQFDFSPQIINERRGCYR